MATQCEIKLDAIKISTDAVKNKVSALNVTNNKILKELEKIALALGA